MDLLFTITCSIWLLSEILLNRLLRAGKTDRQEADKNSLRLIWLTITIAVTLVVYIAGHSKATLRDSTAAIPAGLLIIGTGILLRLWAIRSLGRFFTVDVTIRQGHQLKKDGCYKYVRHPSYSASLLSFIGFGIALNNWISLLVLSVPVLLAFSWRIHIEENILEQQFGASYRDYKKVTRKLIPFIY